MFTVPPNKVMVTGPQLIESATPTRDSVFMCESAHANPAPKLTFKIFNSDGTDVLPALIKSGDVSIRLQETK